MFVAKLVPFGSIREEWWREENAFHHAPLSFLEADKLWKQLAIDDAKKFRIEDGVQHIGVYRGLREAAGKRDSIESAAKRRKIIDSEQALAEAKAANTAIMNKWGAQNSNQFSTASNNSKDQPTVHNKFVQGQVDEYTNKGVLAPSFSRELLEQKLMNDQASRELQANVAEAEAWMDQERIDKKLAQANARNSEQLKNEVLQNVTLAKTSIQSTVQAQVTKNTKLIASVTSLFPMGCPRRSRP